MALTRTPVQTPDLRAPAQDAPATQPGMLPAMFNGPFGANAGLSLARLMGNQAMLALAGIRDGGLGRAEAGLDGALTGLADTVADVPVLGDLAATGAALGRSQVEMGVGFGRGALDLASGLVGAVSNPIALAEGLGVMLDHSPGVVHGRAMLDATGQALDGAGDWSAVAGAGARGMFGAMSLPKGEQAYWRAVGGAVVDPYTKAWSQGRVFEAGGRAIFDLASNLATCGFGAEAEASSWSARLGRGGLRATDELAAALPVVEATEELGGVAPVLEATETVARSDEVATTARLGGYGEANQAERLPFAAKRLDAAAPAKTSTEAGNFGLRSGKADALDIADAPVRPKRSEALAATDNAVEGDALASSEAAILDNPYAETAMRSEETLYPVSAQDQRLLASEIDANAGRMANSELFHDFDADQFRAGSRFVEASEHQRLVVARLMRDSPGMNPKVATEKAAFLPAFEADGGMLISDAVPKEFLTEIVQHEAIHTMAHPSMRLPNTIAMNEGITQYATRTLVSGCSGAYADEVARVAEMAELVGFAPVWDTYRQGGLDKLLDLVETSRIPTAEAAVSDTLPTLTKPGLP